MRLNTKKMAVIGAAVQDTLLPSIKTSILTLFIGG